MMTFFYKLLTNLMDYRLIIVWLIDGLTERTLLVCGAEELQKEKEKCKVVNNELDATFAELTGF